MKFYNGVMAAMPMDHRISGDFLEELRRCVGDAFWNRHEWLESNESRLGLGDVDEGE